MPSGGAERGASEHNVIVCSWCYRSQPFTNDGGASEHCLTSAAELFYLRHVRSCAASAFGHHCTSSAVRSGTCRSGVAVIVEFLTAMSMVFCRNVLMLLEMVMSMFMAALRKTYSALDVVARFFTAVLQSMLSPLEIGACIVVAGANRTECRCDQLVLAVIVLLLASCNWHVPQNMPHHHKVCRLLSAMCMHALYPTSPTMIC